LTGARIAEWAIARLQVEALRQKSTADPGKKREGLQELKKAPSLPRDREPSSDPTWAADTESVVSKHGSYMCTDGKRSGRLHVTSVGVRFETALGFRNQWEMRYENMNRVEKVGTRNSPSQPLIRPLTFAHANCNTPSNRSIESSKSAPAKIYCSSMRKISLSQYLMWRIGMKFSHRLLGIAVFNGRS